MTTKGYQELHLHDSPWLESEEAGVAERIVYKFWACCEYTLCQLYHDHQEGELGKRETS